MDAVNVHASSIILGMAGDPFRKYFFGILFLGESGAGKSDLVLRMIDRGCLLVSDDQTELFVRDDKLFARPPANIAGLLEVRGSGIMELSYEKEAQIMMAVELVTPDAVPRLPEAAHYKPPSPLFLADAAGPPLLRLTSFEPSTPAKIIWSAVAFAQNLFRDEVKKI